MAEKMTTAQRFMKWASEIHLAREHAEKLRREMAAFECQHELAWDLLSESGPGEPFLDRDGCCYRLKDEDRKACWKGRWERHSEYDDGDYVCLGDNREGGWCGPCETREKLRAPYAAARKRLGSLKGALWRLAAKAHAEVEMELDEAAQPLPLPPKEPT